jgi:hypothetical protein
VNSRGLFSCEVSPFVVVARILARETAGSYYAPRLRDLQGFPTLCKALANPEHSGDKMKTAKAICATILLALSLSISAFAEDTNPGEIHTPGKSTQITCDSKSPETKPGEPCTATTDSGDGSFSDLLDFLWAVALTY